MTSVLSTDTKGDKNESKEISTLSLLRETIEKRVFVTRKEKLMFSSSGQEEDWIFDFRKVILDPVVLDAYAEYFLMMYGHLYPFQVGGIETASIPLVAAIVMKSTQKGMPVHGFFIRKSRKKTGLLNMIEGEIGTHPIILVDDLINSGGSFIKQVEILDKERMENAHIPEVIMVSSILRFRNIDEYVYFKKRSILVESFFELDDFIRTLPVANLPDISYPIINPYNVVWCWKEAKPHLWQVRPKSDIIIDDGRLYFGTDGGYFMALDASTGKEVWSYKVLGRSKNVEIFSKAALSSDSVFFGSIDGNIHAISKKDGTRIWIYFDADWVEGDVLYVLKYDLVVASLSYGFIHKKTKVVALNAKKGNLVWSFEMKHRVTKKISYSVRLDMLFFAEDNGLITVIAAKNGALHWQKKLDMVSPTDIVLDESNGHIIVGGMVKFGDSDTRGVVFFLSIKKSIIVRQSEPFSYGLIGRPLLYKGKIIVSSYDKNIYFLDYTSGALLSSIYLGARVFSDPILYENQSSKKVSLFIGTNDAKLHEIDLSLRRIVSVTYFTERITNSIVVDKQEKVVFVKTYANEVYKLLLP